MQTSEKHEIAYQEIVALVCKHDKDLSAIEMLAIAANMVGKLVALQDQRAYTSADIMTVVANNIQIGNEQAIVEIMNAKGSA